MQLNFLLETSTSGGRAAPRTVVLTDLSSVREAGTMPLLHTKPYAHPDCQAGEPSSHDFERHATLVTLLQIMLGEGTSPKWSKETWSTSPPTMSAKIDQLQRDAELKPQDPQTSTLLAKLSDLFAPLKEMGGIEAGEVHEFPGYEQVRRALDDAYKEFRTQVDPNVTSDKHVVTGGDHIDRGAWQIASNSRIYSWIQILQKDEFVTFRSGFGECKKQLIHYLGNLKTSIGTVDGAMQRNAAMCLGRDIAEVLCIHLLRRRYANGAPPRPVTLATLGAEYVGGKPWFHDRMKDINNDASRPAAWVTHSIFPRRTSLSRLCRAIDDLYKMGKPFHHANTREAKPSDVDALLGVLHELFRKDDEREPARQSRILT